jgi:hypothetical protein
VIPAPPKKTFFVALATKASLADVEDTDGHDWRRRRLPFLKLAEGSVDSWRLRGLPPSRRIAMIGKHAVPLAIAFRTRSPQRRASSTRKHTGSARSRLCRIDVSVRASDMTTKISDRSPFVGEWRIVDMELWDRGDLDLLGPAHLTLDRGGLGAMKFLAIEAGVDYRTVRRDGQPSVEFSFEGNDEGDQISGRGWAVLDESTLRGRLFFHEGDESAFSATRQIVPRGRAKRR